MVTDTQYRISLGIGVLSAIVTFIIYTIITELRNLRGSILRCFLASNTICLFSLMITLLILPNDRFENVRIWVQCLLGSTVYFGHASIFWMSVMGFDTWKTFRQIGPIQDVDMEQDEKKKFRLYSIYAWGGSFVVILIVVIGNVVAVSNVYVQRAINLLQWLLQLTIVISNIYFYGSTALVIWRRKRETAQPAVDEVKKYHEENQRWFYLYLGLFVVRVAYAMIALALEIYSQVFEHADPTFLNTAVALRSVLISIICLWRDEVKRYFRKLFNCGKQRTTAFVHGRDSTPASEI